MSIDPTQEFPGAVNINGVYWSADGRWRWDGAQWVQTMDPNVVGTHVTPNSVDSTPRFRSAKGLGDVAVIALIFYVLIDLAWIFALAQNMSYVMQIQNGTLTASLEDVSRSDDLVSGFAVFVLLVLAVAAIAYLIWAYRSYKNLPALGARYLERTPKWIVWASVIPIVSFYLPYQLIKTVWLASDPANDHSSPDLRRQAKGWWVLNMWWACWIIGNLIGYISRFIAQPNDAASLVTAREVVIAAQLLLGGAAVLLILVIRSVTSRQLQRAVAGIDDVCKWERYGE